MVLLKLAAGRRFALSDLRYCSACSASFNSGKRFSYSVGSARDWAAFAFVLAKSSRHRPTTLREQCDSCLGYEEHTIKSIHTIVNEGIRYHIHCKTWPLQVVPNRA